MAKTTLVVALVGEKTERSPLVAYLAQISRWQISWRWSTQLPEDVKAFDLGIVYTKSWLAERAIATSPLPIIAIPDEAAVLPEQTGVEYIPRNVLNAFSLETTMRLLLQATPSNAPQSPPAQGISGAAMRPSISISLSSAGKILSWNEAAANFYGYQPTEVLGEDYVSLFIPPGDRHTFNEKFRLALQGINVPDYQYLVITSEALSYTLTGQLQLITDPQNPEQIVTLLCMGQPTLFCPLTVATEPTNNVTARRILQENSGYPSARDRQEHLHFTQTLAQFSRILSNPDSKSTLATALGLFGKILAVQRVTILKWQAYDKQQGYPPIVMDQWSSDQSPPCHQRLSNIPFKYWCKLLHEQQLTNLYNVEHDPDLAKILVELNIASLLALPIKDTQGKLWGYLIFSGDRPVEQPYSEFVLQILQMATELIHHYLLRIFAQRELEASETLYSGIVLHSAEAIFLLRVTNPTDFVFAMVNATYCKLTGLQDYQVIGKTLTDIFPPAIATQFLKSCETCLRTEEAIVAEDRLPFEGGEQIWRTSFVPIRDRQGRITHVQGSGRNVTGERKLELAKMRNTRQQHLLTSLSLRVLESWQTDKMLATTVAELRQTLQVDRVIFLELQNRQVGIVLHEAAIATVPSMLNQTFPLAAFDRGDFQMFQQGEIQTCTDVAAAKFPTEHDAMLNRFGVKSYTVLPVISAIKLDPNGEPTLKGLLCIQQCHQAKTWTADELHFFRQLTNQVSIALNQAELLRQQKHHTKELARSNKELEQFAYIASHDLQEPLQIVSSYAQLLAKRGRDRLDQSSLRYIFHIVEGTKRMQQQIQDLLRYSRLNTCQNPFQLIELRDPLEQAIANLQIKIKQNQAKIIIPESLPQVWGDRSNLQNLWQNLISNAIKYRSEYPPEITITIQQKQNEWQIKIQDNGIGIASKHYERIFRIFQRLHTQEEYPGTGIGLAICQRVVNQHGGQIWLDDASSQGAAFIFTLPIVISAKMLRQSPNLL